MRVSELIAIDRQRQLNGDKPIQKCCTCFEELFVGEKAYKDSGMYYCEECFIEMVKEEHETVLGEDDIEIPDESDL